MTSDNENQVVSENPVGKTLKQRSKRYSVKYDAETTVWRILDLWHPELEKYGLDSDIVDENPAMTILPHGGFEALIEEANRLGILSKYVNISTAVEESSQSSSNPTSTPKQSTPVGLPPKLQVTKIAIDAVVKLAGIAEIDEVMRGDKQ